MLLLLLKLVCGLLVGYPCCRPDGLAVGPSFCSLLVVLLGALFLLGLTPVFYLVFSVFFSLPIAVLGH
jgi:hypothetical protein